MNEQDADEAGRAGPDATEPSTGAKPAVADMQAFIGRQLRAVYDDVAKQPVPDRFLELMRQLDTKPATG